MLYGVKRREHSHIFCLIPSATYNLCCFLFLLSTWYQHISFQHTPFLDTWVSIRCHKTININQNWSHLPSQQQNTNSKIKLQQSVFPILQLIRCPPLITVFIHFIFSYWIFPSLLQFFKIKPQGLQGRIADWFANTQLPNSFILRSRPPIQIIFYSLLQLLVVRERKSTLSHHAGLCVSFKA